MSIKGIDELRELPLYGAVRVNGKLYDEKLMMVSATKEQVNEIADKIEREIAERYLELPLDADGVPIRMGECVEGKTLEGRQVKGEVSALHIYDDGTGSIYLHVRCGEGAYTVKELKFLLCHHVKQRTLEDVLEEFAACVLNSGHQWGLDAAEATAKYAEKLREVLRDELS